MLTLVRPPLEGQGGDPPKRRRQYRSLSLTQDERQRLRAALRNLRLAYGSWGCLAEVMGVSESTLSGVANGKDPGSPGLVLLAARAAGTSVERILAAGPVEADRCPFCWVRRARS